jgi:tRNA nucleotidyltransferase/poly(A) polymerase
MKEHKMSTSQAALSQVRILEAAIAAFADQYVSEKKAPNRRRLKQPPEATLQRVREATRILVAESIQLILNATNSQSRVSRWLRRSKNPARRTLANAVDAISRADLALAAKAACLSFTNKSLRAWKLYHQVNAKAKRRRLVAECEGFYDLMEARVFGLPLPKYAERQLTESFFPVRFRRLPQPSEFFPD